MSFLPEVNEAVQKIVWIKSYSSVKNTDDGLTEVNEYLKQGWVVKMLSTCATNSLNQGQAYVVLEK